MPDQSTDDWHPSKTQTPFIPPPDAILCSCVQLRLLFLWLILACAGLFNPTSFFFFFFLERRSFVLRARFCSLIGHSVFGVAPVLRSGGPRPGWRWSAVDS